MLCKPGSLLIIAHSIRHPFLSSFIDKIPFFFVSFWKILNLYFEGNESQIRTYRFLSQYV